MYKYFVTRNGVEREVTVSEFCSAERSAGFRGPGHHETPMSPATHSFGNNGISGRTSYIPDEALKDLVAQYYAH